MDTIVECPSCHTHTSFAVLTQHLHICPQCAYHHRINAKTRIAYTADVDSFVEFGEHMCSQNPIDLPGYAEKLAETRKQAALNEAVVTGTCTIEGKAAVLAVMSFDFMGGSMGSVVGEKITQALFEGALTKKPVIIFTASGGARMQEGIFSLMQMAKTASAAALLDQAKVPLFIVLTHPTTGGVTASFAMLGDIIVAEPGALIGFAGPRVIEGTIGQKLPKGFQTAEFQLEKGFIDIIASRTKMRSTLSYLIHVHSKEPS